MKAKEYAKRLIENRFDKDSMNFLMRNFGKEIVELTEKRKAYSHDAYLNVLKQQYQKWKAISRKTDGVLRENGFFDMIEIIGGDSGKKIAKFAKEKFG
jgi:hypothetical protein